MKLRTVSSTRIKRAFTLPFLFAVATSCYHSVTSRAVEVPSPPPTDAFEARPGNSHPNGAQAGKRQGICVPEPTVLASNYSSSRNECFVCTDESLGSKLSAGLKPRIFMTILDHVVPTPCTVYSLLRSVPPLPAEDLGSILRKLSN